MASVMKKVKRIKGEHGETIYVYRGYKIYRVKRGNSIYFQVDGTSTRYCLLSTAMWLINKKIQGEVI